jgi:CubicO group peptidase (beta-lactamase class C family)
MKDSTDINSELVDLEKEITFRHLLTHTSGLCMGFKEISTEVIDEIYRDSGVIGPILIVSKLPLQEFTQKLTELPLATQPGTRFRYSLAFEVLGYLVGLISEKPFDEFLRERIFEPLGMHDTSSVVPSCPKEKSNVLVLCIVPPAKTGCRYLMMWLLATIFAQIKCFGVGVNMGGPYFGRQQQGYGFGVGVSVAGAPRFGWIGISGTMAWFYPRKEMLVMAMPQAHFNWEASDTLVRMAREVIAT